MGGIVCQILHNAIITDANSDTQWRALFGQQEVAQAVANDTGSADKLCELLAKHAFTAADRAWFGQLVASLWVGYS